MKDPLTDVLAAVDGLVLDRKFASPHRTADAVGRSVDLVIADLDLLQRDGLVDVEHDPVGGRCYFVTEAGMARVQEAANVWAQSEGLL